MVLVEFSISPLDKGMSLGPYVARAIDIVDRSGIDYRLGPMGTVLEGEWDEVFAVIKRCFDELDRDCERISLSIKVDYRKGARGRLRGKLETIERELGRSVRT